MTASLALLILTLLFVKHFVVDFPLQAHPYQYKNKGTYGHPGGILHSGLHTVGTFLVVYWFTVPAIAILLALADGLVHYHIDWAKMNLNKKLGYGPTTHEEFWVLLGLDQLLHALTYIGIVFFLV
jgi:hypothetical protein